jgi:hypothetical protein
MLVHLDILCGFAKGPFGSPPRRQLHGAHEVGFVSLRENKRELLPLRERSGGVERIRTHPKYQGKPIYFFKESPANCKAIFRIEFHLLRTM